MNTVNRIIINTLAQYVKIILGAVLMLYATRIVLSELGDSDFGLYSLLGSVIAFLSFISISLARSTQRFLSYHAGAHNIELQRKVFCNSICLHFFASLIISIVILVSENILFEFVFDIDKEKIKVAKVLYRLMIVGVFVTINSSPFIAVFIAHENIVFTSLLHLGMYVLRLMGALSLSLFDALDRLEIYGFIMVVIPAVEMLVYILVSHHKYDECRGFLKRGYYDKRMLKNFLSFSGWNMYGNVCVMSRQQGYAMALNHYLGLVYNSGYGIATQISTQINSMVYAISNAVSPIITKSEGARDRIRMIYGCIESSKVSFLFFVILIIPYLFFGKIILEAWLKDVPPASFMFSCVIMLSSMLDSFSSGLRTGIFAIGKIKNYSLIVYSMKALSIFISIVVFIFKGDLFLSVLPYLLTDALGSLLTIRIFCRLTDESYHLIVKNILGKCIAPLLIVIGACTLFKVSLQIDTVIGVIVVYVIIFFVTSGSAYFFSLDNKERNTVKTIILSFRNR